MMIYPKLKRIIDFALSLVGMTLLSPVFVLLTILIKFDSKGTVFFRQKRVGKNKKHFYILKFRTMSMDSPNDTATHMLQDPDKFITKIGKLLRKTSLDELPQMINIIKGDMSIVGPRPALWNQYDLIAERDQYGANDIYPGLTGWAQINGRDELSIQVKAMLDGEYVQRISIGMDVKCILGTIVSILKSDGIVEGGTDKRIEKEVVSTKETISK